VAAPTPAIQNLLLQLYITACSWAWTEVDGVRTLLCMKWYRPTFYVRLWHCESLASTLTTHFLWRPLQTVHTPSFRTTPLVLWRPLQTVHTPSFRTTPLVTTFSFSLQLIMSSGTWVEQWQNGKLRRDEREGGGEGCRSQQFWRWRWKWKDS